MAATTVSLHYHSLTSHHRHHSTTTHLPIIHHHLTATAGATPFLQKGLIGSRNWGIGARSGIAMGDSRYDIDDDDDEDDDDEEEEEEDRSLDLLIRFVENVFRKVSRKARRAVRSVLPVPISTRLVGFAVNGVIILTFLWVLKAFLEVICTFGSVVFASILLVRGVWTGISYFQESRNYRADDDEPNAWSGARPAA